MKLPHRRALSAPGSPASRAPTLTQTEAEAVAAQHDLDKQEWQAEMGRQQAAHDKAMGQVRFWGLAPNCCRIRCNAAIIYKPWQPFPLSLLPCLYVTCLHTSYPASPGACRAGGHPGGAAPGAAGHPGARLCHRHAAALRDCAGRPRGWVVPATKQACLATVREPGALHASQHGLCPSHDEKCSQQLSQSYTWPFLAGALNAALAGAAADVALLFQRWDEKNALEDANSALVQVRAAALFNLLCFLRRRTKQPFKWTWHQLRCSNQRAGPM